MLRIIMARLIAALTFVNETNGKRFPERAPSQPLLK
jgi:hypothetical protein